MDDAGRTARLMKSVPALWLAEQGGYTRMHLRVGRDKKALFHDLVDPCPFRAKTFDSGS